MDSAASDGIFSAKVNVIIISSKKWQKEKNT